MNFSSILQWIMIKTQWVPRRSCSVNDTHNSTPIHNSNKAVYSSLLLFHRLLPMESIESSNRSTTSTAAHIPRYDGVGPFIDPVPLHELAKQQPQPQPRPQPTIADALDPAKRKPSSALPIVPNMQNSENNNTGNGREKRVYPPLQLNHRTFEDLVAEISPDVKLDDAVQKLLMQMTEDFADQVADFAVRLAKHRGSKQLETKDLSLHLEKAYGMRIPGFMSELEKASLPQQSHTAQQNTQKL